MHRIYEVPGDGPRVTVLHAAGVTPENMAKLVGPMPGFHLLFPEAANGERWDHLFGADVDFLRGVGGDFICGFSSGAFMCARMLEVRQYLAAVMVAGGFIKALRPKPTPLMLIHGTEDKQVPYGGTRYVHGALETAIVMRKALGIAASPTHKTIPNRNKLDGCTAYIDGWAGRVKLFTVVGGGHTWPSGAGNPPALGRVCRDFSATADMAEFFKGIAP